MGLKQDLQTARAAVHAAWHNTNTRLAEYAVEPVPTLGALPSAIPAVYASGEAAGERSGAQTAYDAFWDSFQQKGSRTGYTQAFAYAWSAETFRPKYDMKPANATGMFNQSRIRGDLGALLEEAGVTLDFSGIKSNLGGNIFYSSLFTRLPKLDFTSLTILSNTFAGATSLETIDEIKLKSDGSTTFSGTFTTCPALKQVAFSGTIGSTLSLSSCVGLSRASIENVVSCLSDTATGMTLTVSQTAVDAAFEADEWTALIASKPNWTIALA